MALTLQRWLAIAVGGCLIAMALVLSSDWPSGRRRTPDPRATVADRERGAAIMARRAARRLHMVVLRDSVRVALKKVPRAGATRIVVAIGVPERARFARVLAARLATVLPEPVANPVDIVVPADSVNRWNDRWNAQTFPAASSEPCVAISGRSSDRWTGADFVRNIVGPCGFYATFGVPGAGIDRWLKAGAWIYGTNWAASTPRPLLLRRSNWGNVSFGESAGLSMRDLVSTQGYSCVTGNRVACRQLLLDPLDYDAWRSDRIHFTSVRIDSDGMWSMTNRFYFWALLGPQMRSLLADMATSLGPDRFRRFWSSALPPDEAFQAATGQDIGDWTAEWARRNYGEQGSGPGVTPWSATLSVALSLLALAGAIVSSRRRQVA